MTQLARAAVFETAGQRMALAEFPLPSALCAGELLVRVSLATICGSDLHTVSGRRVEPTPCVLGHEGVGVVVAAGSGREALLQRRISWSSADSCGRCAACTDFDLPQKCVAVLKYGHVAIGARGALLGSYATHITLGAGTHVVPLPAAVSDAAAATANCALATMVHAIEVLPRHCRTAVILGAGLLGLYGCALLRAAGVERVVVVDTDAARLKMVPRFGGIAAQDSARSCLLEHTADLLVEAAGQPALVAEALRLLRPGGHCVLVGLVHPGAPLDLHGEALVRGCVTLRGVHNYAPRHLDGAIRFLATHHDELPFAELVSPPLPLEQIEAAFALASSRRWLRVAIAPGGAG